MAEKRGKDWLKFRVTYRSGVTPWKYAKVDWAGVVDYGVAEGFSEQVFGLAERGNAWSNLEWHVIARPPKEYLDEKVRRARVDFENAVDRLEESIRDATTYSSKRGGTLEESDAVEARRWLEKQSGTVLTDTEIVQFIGKFGVHPRVAAGMLKVKPPLFY